MPINTPVDLSNCDKEPIHIPGQIQSHGFLIVVNQDCIITYHSDNIASFIPGIKPNLLGEHINDIEQLTANNDSKDLICQLITLGKHNKSFDQTNPFSIDLQGKPFYLIISPTEQFFLLEFEPADSDLNIDLQKIIGRSVSEMLADKNLQRLLDNTAAQIKQIIDYDRVMIYRFAEDGHGEVVAESRNADLDSWMGLHYPASDIPKQARELYKLNLTRLIADVHTTPSKIITSADNGQPLDLTPSQLRAVSPIHIQYLKNMEVGSSFSISLIYKKELWGLIACHNYSPRFIDFKSRESSKLIGQILSSALEFRQDEENQQTTQRYKSAVDQISKYLLKSMSIEDALTQQEVTVLDAVDADGAIVVYENSIIKLGITPDDDELRDLLTWVKGNLGDSFHYTNNLASVYPQAAAYRDVASGLMLSVLSHEMNEYVIWFKPEQIQTIKWAGNPEKPVELNANGLTHISPRNSFAEWTQTVSGTSKNWSNEEIKSAARLREEITYAINQKAGEIRALNEKLKLAYEELDTFSYTISHDLKNPLSTIKSYSQILTRNGNLEPRAQQIMERIIVGADKMNLMINEVLGYSKLGRSEIEAVEIDMAPVIDELIKDLLVAYNSPDIDIQIGKTPAIHGDPVMINQVFANLISNAIKYSIPSGSPKVTIEGTATETGVVYSISDNGIGIDIQYLPKVFELFNRMDNARDIEGSGVGLSIVKRIIDKHRGKIWVDSELNKGSTFYVEFFNR
ncbi:ATP-binding protein [Mucilaginibacter agri]|uniref:histidine kinase n=1 Tax=Mucilaginibacter agri TaxID=2695265 RepID=A0A965ZIY3_9SPHI|nr:ATP-binding protein [Mucilaginibacter agri]NCD70577.1 GAF domain-containing protein [Mucilaginibacter agri]